MVAWNGEERRRERIQDDRDHDALTKVIQILETHVKNFDSHIQDDKKNFEFLNRTVWIGMGAIFMFEIIMKLTGK